jgi:hypothetical protein
MNERVPLENNPKYRRRKTLKATGTLENAKEALEGASKVYPLAYRQAENPYCTSLS